jgi:RHS repeat-associated protein
LSDASGVVTDTYDFDAFGNQVAHTGTTVNQYLFNGQQYDANSGFYHLRARYYQPDTGRFTAFDPYLGDPYAPATLHKYLYAANDPVNKIDPTGEEFDLGSMLTSMAIQGTISAILSGGTTYAITRDFKKSLAAAGGGFIVGALIGGVINGARAIILARSAAAVGDAAGDILITADKMRYLLVLDAGKANGFKLLGYTVENAKQLEDMLAASQSLITNTTAKAVTQYGTQYTVSMEIVGANGVKGIIDVGWQIDHGSTVYRLITAIPHPF